MNLRETIAAARQKGVAVGHFNVSTLDGAFAVADAARDLGVPVIIGVSEGEREYTGVREIAAVVRAMREGRGQPIFLNADHTYSFDKVKEAIDAGFDAAIYDGAKLPLDENIAQAAACVAYARSTGRDILIEGELGYIGQSSQVLDAVPQGVQLTDPADAERFVRETGVDMLAPAVGNFHGLLGGDRALTLAAKRIDPTRVAAISQATGVPLVLHGGSGQGDALVVEAIAAGVAVVHVNTELRVAYRSSLTQALSDDPDTVAPYKYMKPAKLAMQQVVAQKLRVFNRL